MKVTIGCPVKNRAWVLPRWYDALQQQNVDIQEIICLVSPSDDETETILKERDVTIINDERPGRRPNEIIGHAWGMIEDYQYMANIRNVLLEAVKASNPDAFLSLDSDIILPKNGLKRLLEILAVKGGVVSPYVSMNASQYCPNMMTWQSPRELAYRPPTFPKQLSEVDVIMAAMLMDRNALGYVRWEAHPQGEDLGFCKVAELYGVHRWWAPSIHCDHIMQPDQ